MKKSWKTTLAGLMVGLPLAAQALLDAYAKGAFEGKHGIALFAAMGIIILGLVSKDSNVTGGTAPATPEAEKRLDGK